MALAEVVAELAAAVAGSAVGAVGIVAVAAAAKDNSCCKIDISCTPAS